MNNISEISVKEVILSFLSEEVRFIFSHRRLYEPLDLSIKESVSKFDNMNQILLFISEEANKNAINTSLSINGISNQKEKNASEIIIHAWVHLYEACVSGIYEI